MTTIQLNAEIYRTMGIIAEDESLLRQALKYLKELASQKTNQTPIAITDSFAEKTGNCAYIENGQVVTNIVTETLNVEEAKRLSLKVIDLEYSLP